MESSAALLAGGLRPGACTAAAPWLAASSTANRASHSFTALRRSATRSLTACRPRFSSSKPSLLFRICSRRSVSAWRAVCCALLGLLRAGLQLLVPGDHLGLRRLHLGDLGLDRAEPADLLLLPPEPGVELAVQPGELGDLGGGPVHRLALLLQRRGLLGELVGQRLEHGELVLDVGNGLGGLVERLQRALDALHPADHVVQPAGGGACVLVEGLEPARWCGGGRSARRRAGRASG